MRSILGQCAECCECPPAIVRSATVSASRSKCGTPEFSGYESSPPVIYLVKTVTNNYSLSNVQTSAHESEESCCVVSVGTITKSASGSIVYTTDVSDCTESASETPPNGPTDGSNVNTYSDSSCSSVDCSAKSNSVTDPTVNNVPWNQQAPTGFCSSPYTDDSHTDTTATSQTIFNSRDHSDSYPGTPTCECDTYDSLVCHEESTLTTELSSPYLTSVLITNVDADLAAETYPEKTTGLPVASFLISSDETSASAEASKYEIAHKVPKVGRGACFKATWVERFTPEDGDPVDTDKSYTWDGTIPGDYDPTDADTYPVSSEFVMLRPTDEGETTIGYYTDPEDPETFVEGYVLAECRGCVA